MLEVTSKEFAKHFGRYRTAAQKEPVKVTNHGEVTGYFVSAEDFEAYRLAWILQQRTFRMDALPEELAAAIEAADYDNPDPVPLGPSTPPERPK